MKNTIDLKIAGKLINLHQSAKDREIYFDLSFKKVKQLVCRKTCYFTGVVFDDKVNSSQSRSIDRIDNTKGYIDSNVVACTKEFNILKGELTLEQITMLYNKCIKGRKK